MIMKTQIKTIETKLEKSEDERDKAHTEIERLKLIIKNGGLDL